MVYFLIMVMVLGWSLNFIVAKWTLREIPAFAFLFLRVYLSTLILLVWYYASGRYRSRYRQAGEWKWFALLGVLGIGMNQAGFVLGLNYTSVGHSSLIIATTPIYVLLVAAWMKQEALTLQKVLGLVLSLVGVVILTLEHGLSAHTQGLLGDIITLCGSVGFAFYAVYSKQLAESYDTLTMITFVYLAGVIVVTPMAGWQLFDLTWTAITWRGWLGLLYNAAIASVMGYMIFYYALTKISATRVSAFSYLQPVLATFFSILLLGDHLTPHLVGGGALVLVGVVLAERGRG